MATPPPPLATTLAAGIILDTGATLNGSVTATGYTTNVSFEYGLTNSYGATVAATPASVAGVTTSAASAAIIGLRPGTVYHYRIVAASPAGGMARGDDMTLTTTTLASLASLGLSGGVLIPALTAANTGYVITVPYATTSITLTPGVADPGTAVTINGTPVASGTASAPVNLAVGNTIINCVVTAARWHEHAELHFHRHPSTPDIHLSTRPPTCRLTAQDLVATGNAATFALNYAPVAGTNLTVVNNTGTIRFRDVLTIWRRGKR